VIEGYTPESLTTLEVESTVSVVARHPRVRAWMRSRQRALGRSGAVMEGRDIASTVFPDAQVKLFLTAGPDERARRRVADRPTIGADVSGSLRARDELDARTNPLEPVEDAVMIDTGSLDVEATLEAALRVVRERVPDVEAP
jgi:cytidylate kinase